MTSGTLPHADLLARVLDPAGPEMLAAAMAAGQVP